ncbi:PIN domain nuclease [Phragmitibacter flavus]|uniref:PIN domain nuclease n=1 Tax=Phragmitibacter flavus TaxID=2576071 RepID=A0A5R8K7N5_9BACT|nr:PIN domain-containing protein [Phragmitibacter flavus]TLD68352.1 PIN domain nuclease [Phragmitibacter flavus]
MAKEPILIDSSYYIQEAQEGRNPLRLLAYLAVERDLVICGLVRCEVGRGIRDIHVRQAFKRVWDVMINVPVDAHLWQEAEDLAWTLDRRGITLPLQDIVIACCAAKAGAIVLTHDKHFKTIPGCKTARSAQELI